MKNPTHKARNIDLNLYHSIASSDSREMSDLSCLCPFDREIHMIPVTMTTMPALSFQLIFLQKIENHTVHWWQYWIYNNRRLFQSSDWPDQRSKLTLSQSNKTSTKHTLLLRRDLEGVVFVDFLKFKITKMPKYSTLHWFFTEWFHLVFEL